MDEPEDINDRLRRHRRSIVRPWLCRCGSPHPCSARQLGVRERDILRRRADLERVIAQMGKQPGPERNQHPLGGRWWTPSKATPATTNSGPWH